MTAEGKLKVLVNGEWHDASPEFIETVRQIDEGLKRKPIVDIDLIANLVIERLKEGE